MKMILDKIGAVRLTPVRFFGFWVTLFTLVFALSSCSDDLDVQQSYPFTVEVMPYGDKIKQGETVELRFEIKPEGNYSNTLYTIRYFQYDGEGTLKLVDGPVLVNTDGGLIKFLASWKIRFILHRGSRLSSLTVKTATMTAVELSVRWSGL